MDIELLVWQVYKLETWSGVAISDETADKRKETRCDDCIPRAALLGSARAGIRPGAQTRSGNSQSRVFNLSWDFPTLHASSVHGMQPESGTDRQTLQQTVSITTPARIAVSDDLQSQHLWRLLHKHLSCPATLHTSDDTGCINAKFLTWEFTQDVEEMPATCWSLGGTPLSAGHCFMFAVSRAVLGTVENLVEILDVQLEKGIGPKMVSGILWILVNGRFEPHPFTWNSASVINPKGNARICGRQSWTKSGEDEQPNRPLNGTKTISINPRKSYKFQLGL
ncbi:hypothetical protein B0H13DRAFT_1923632 [Mycena leptocephala]|nr:hypothetical protein B0H13DRAFT_1923632 [Mycena leptocephala]